MTNNLREINRETNGRFGEHDRPAPEVVLPRANSEPKHGTLDDHFPGLERQSDGRLTPTSRQVAALVLQTARDTQVRALASASATHGELGDDESASAANLANDRIDAFDALLREVEENRPTVTDTSDSLALRNID